MKSTIFYDGAMNSTLAEGVSPSANKPRLFKKHIEKFKEQIAFISVVPVMVQDLYSIHSKEYVDSILNGKLVNGFGIKGDDGQDMASSFFYTSGSMLNATRFAIETGGFACSPTSGFHHACFARPFGFCTFNGLFLAAMKAINEYGAKRVLILDCDYHWGDGTYSLIKQFGMQHEIFQWSAGLDYWCSTLAEEMLQRLTEMCNLYIPKVDLVLYQAGADQHVDDPLGGLLTTRQMKIRDAIVFTTAKRYKKPVVWNLAGGYQEPIEKVLDLHLQTLQVAHQVQFDESLSPSDPGVSPG